MSIQDQLRLGATNEYYMPLGLDYSSKQYRAVMLDATNVGFFPSAAVHPPDRFGGILQNAADIYTHGCVRFAGWSYAVYGATVTAGDLLRIEEVGTYDRFVPFVLGSDGHFHESDKSHEQSILVRVIHLLTAQPVLSLTDTDIIAKQWRRVGGTISEHLDSTSVTEDDGGDGWYVVATTETDNPDQPHRLSIEPLNPDHAITPREHQWTPRYKSDGPANGSSFRFCIGQALTSGVADEVGLIMLRSQVF